VPLPAPDVAGRSAPARSHRRRGHRRGGTSLARPTGRGESVGGGCARWAEVEHGRQRGGAAASTACWRSRRGAGKHGQPKRTKASGRSKEAIPILNLAEEGVEVGRRR
jgi:hypothetical protein